MTMWIIKTERYASLHFYDIRFFLGREIPRESLVFMIRAFGGEASWDETCAPGATFNHELSEQRKVVQMICKTKNSNQTKSYCFSEP